MEITFKQTVQIMVILLFAAAITQSIYTALYVLEMSPPRQLLWGLESALFVLLAAVAGSALVRADLLTLGFSAIVCSALLNVVQVSVGLTLFAPFGEAAAEMSQLAPTASAVVAFSFMVYNAAKVLLAIAAVVFGMAMVNGGSKALGYVSALVGFIAIIANTASMAMGRDVFGPLPIAGGSGVVTTILLAVCLLIYARSLPEE